MKDPYDESVLYTVYCRSWQSIYKPVSSLWYCTIILQEITLAKMKWVLRSILLSRQEYWSGLPCPLPGDLPEPEGWNLHLLCLLHWQADSIPLSHLGRLVSLCKYTKPYCGRKCQNTAVRCPCKRHVQVLIRGDCQHHLVWKQALCRYN